MFKPPHNLQLISTTVMEFILKSFRKASKDSFKADTLSKKDKTRMTILIKAKPNKLDGQNEH